MGRAYSDGSSRFFEDDQQALLGEYHGGRRRIYGFRAKLQTPQFVSTPSCVTMKLNRGVFPGKKTRDRSIERFQDLQLLSFQQNAPKNRLFFSGFQASEPAAPDATGVQ